MTYKLADAKQTIIGAMTGILGLILFFVFGTKQFGVVLEPWIGFFFTILFLFLSYVSLKKFMGKDSLLHLSVDYILCLAISVIFAFMFKMIDTSFLIKFDFFGTVPIIVSWVIFIPAIVFDVKDVGGFIERYTYFANKENGNNKLALQYYCTAKYQKEQIEKCIKGE